MDLLFCKRRNKNPTQSFEDEEDNDEKGRVKYLAQKSGFVSLKERVNSLAEQARNSNNDNNRRLATNGGGATRQSHQFANLHELFASKSISHRPHSVGGGASNSEGWYANEPPMRKHKIPVMRLSKDDWNVKCWEDRLSSHKRRQQENYPSYNYHHHQNQMAGQRPPIRPRKPVRQVEAFRGRIEDVATRLEKVREGAPQDERLYKLTLNGGRETKSSSHEWTDLLKAELERGTHDPKVLRSELAHHPKGPKSPLGRPIGRIFQEEEEEGNVDTPGGQPEVKRAD